MDSLINSFFAAGAQGKSASVVMLDSWSGTVTNRAVNIGTPDPRRHLVICNAQMSANGLPHRSTPSIDGSSNGITEILDHVNNAFNDGHATALYTVKKQSGTSVSITVTDSGEWIVYAVYGINNMTTASNVDTGFTTSNVYAGEEHIGFRATNTTTTPANGCAFMLGVTNWACAISNVTGIDPALSIHTNGNYATVAGCDQFTESRTTYSYDTGCNPVICDVVSFSYN